MVIVLPDGGDRYLDTIYDDTWVQRHFGDVAHLWDGPSDAGFVGQLADIAQ